MMHGQKNIKVTLLEPSGPLQVCNGTAVPLPLPNWMHFTTYGQTSIPKLYVLPSHFFLGFGPPGLACSCYRTDRLCSEGSCLVVQMQGRTTGVSVTGDIGRLRLCLEIRSKS